MKFRNDESTMSVTHSYAMSMQLSGGMICIRGKNIGFMVDLPTEQTIVAGRSAKVSNHIIPDPGVSKKHFEITYLGMLDKYLVKDCSSVGTFLGSGQRLIPGKDYYVDPGTELWLGNTNNVYKLR